MSRLDRLTKLLAVDPNDSFVLYGLAMEHRQAGNTDQAVAFFDRCLAADPNYSYAYFHKSRALQADGRDTEALAAAKAGLQVAKSIGDAKAAGELGSLVDELS